MSIQLNFGLVFVALCVMVAMFWLGALYNSRSQDACVGSLAMKVDVPYEVLDYLLVVREASGRGDSALFVMEFPPGAKSSRIDVGKIITRKIDERGKVIFAVHEPV